MGSSENPISHLKKVHLDLTLTCEGDGSSSHEAVRQSLDFVYGVASSGLTPFEFQISNCKIGDTLSLVLDPQEWLAYFGHLPLVWPLTLSDTCRRQVDIQVKTIDTPSQREIVQALADGAACGEGCCGNH